MNDKCPYCGGRLIEKHQETVSQRGKAILFVHYRCVSCGKWTKYENM